MLVGNKSAVLVGVELTSGRHITLAESLPELKRLADTAGIAVVGEVTQKRPRPDNRTYVGKGKVEELVTAVAARQANLAIFDAELSPAQARNLEEILKIKIMDRAELIINIFAQHAHSREGKIQVELAQLAYQMPRLRGLWEHLPRQRGGTGLRDVGETQIELDRRAIQKRIISFKKEIETVRKNRRLRREKRRKTDLATVALVGYTNAGKSTLLNALAGENIYTADKLFATLDPTTRRARLPNGKTILLTDTVGFIQKLPHQLIAAFRATLEEVTEADVLLHVVDASHPHFESQIHSVYTVLEELNAIKKPMITVFNKIDLRDKPVSAEWLKKYQPAVAISALGQQLAPLLSILSSTLQTFAASNSAARR